MVVNELSEVSEDDDDGESPKKGYALEKKLIKPKGHKKRRRRVSKREAKGRNIEQIKINQKSEDMDMES